MDREQVAEMLRASLDDRRLSRAERRALTAHFAELSDPARGLDQFRQRAFAAAAAACRCHEDQQLLEWLAALLKLLQRQVPPPMASAVAYFSPGDDCLEAIRGFVGEARKTLDVCVFTITDDRISERLIDAHRRGVAVRVITDNCKAADAGSDIVRLDDCGIPTAVDDSAKHMHHKFAIADRRRVLTGSYNWTRSAATANEENIVIVEDAHLTASFAREFDRLWQNYR